jgi:hypothetical protein
MIETAIDPRHPRRLEKKANISLRRIADREGSGCYFVGAVPEITSLAGGPH